MNMKINTTFDNSINSFVVRMPKEITFEALTLWEEVFLELLSKEEKCKNITCLVDTNKHKFESITSLKLLRDILSKIEMQYGFVSLAFVQPEAYRKPSIVSSKEGYFICFKDAYEWLEEKN